MVARSATGTHSTCSCTGSGNTVCKLLAKSIGMQQLHANATGASDCKLHQAELVLLYKAWQSCCQ